MFRICAIGDVVGKAGRRCVARILPHIRKEFDPHIVLCNGENAAGGFGLTKKVYEELSTKQGIDAITMGNHWHDKREIYEFGPKMPNLVLPGNMENVETLGEGLKILTSASGQRYAVINLIGRAFMKHKNSCPFQAADELIGRIPSSVKIRIVDFHAEATSEKQALAQYLRRRISLFYGTHTHTPTADERIFDAHTGFATDVGMTGAYDSVIGIKTETSLSKFLGTAKKSYEPAKKDPWLCALLATVDPETGACKDIRRTRIELSLLGDE